MKKFMIVIALIFTWQGTAFSDAVQEAALSFLGSAPLPAEAREALKNRISADKEVSLWGVGNGESVYVLCVEKIPAVRSRAGSGLARRNLMQIARMKASVSAAEYLGHGKLDREIFSNKDAAGYALQSWYSSKLQYAARAEGAFAVSLVWGKRDDAPIPQDEITGYYCSYLYDRANRLFSQKDFAGALEAFHQIHYLAWANVRAYLGASECFLMMGQKDDSARLASEVISVLSGDMTPEDIASAGRILFDSGNKDEGFAAMELAFRLKK